MNPPPSPPNSPPSGLVPLAFVSVSGSGWLTPWSVIQPTKLKETKALWRVGSLWGGRWVGSVRGEGGAPLDANWQNKWPLLGLHGGKGFVTVTLPPLLLRFWMFHGCYSYKPPQLPSPCLYQPWLGHAPSFSFTSTSASCPLMSLLQVKPLLLLVQLSRVAAS